MAEGDHSPREVREPDPPSEELLRRGQAGDSRALDDLFARYRFRLLRWARHRVPSWARNGVDTEDLVQETVAHAFRHVRTFEPRRDGALLGYLRRSLLNRVRDQFRAAARRPRSVPLDDRHPDPGGSPLAATIRREERERYQRALARLRAADRNAVVARLDLGYSYEQLALVLGKPTAEAARLAVRRALLRLAEEMEHE